MYSRMQPPLPSDGLVSQGRSRRGKGRKRPSSVEMIRAVLMAFISRSQERYQSEIIWIGQCTMLTQNFQNQRCFYLQRQKQVPCHRSRKKSVNIFYYAMLGVNNKSLIPQLLPLGSDEFFISGLFFFCMIFFFNLKG